MLYQFGALQFEKFPISIKEYTGDRAADFAEKAIVGGLQPLEPVGEGSDEFSLVCALYPHRYDGLGELEILDGMRLAQQEYILVRGDGTALGWRVITRIRERGAYLDLDGVGRCIEVEITWKKVPAPSAGTAIGLIQTILGLL